MAFYVSHPPADAAEYFGQLDQIQFNMRQYGVNLTRDEAAIYWRSFFNSY